MKFLEWLTPRRSFAYRQLEARLTEVVKERDDYREKWIDAVNQALTTARQPRIGVASGPPPPPPEKKLTFGEIQAEFQQKRELEYQLWLNEQKATGQVNDLE